MASKIKGLLMWCQKMTDGYRDVRVKDFTTSWRDGMAFCAIVHRFRPDLIDYDSLSKENVFENNDLAFKVAEAQLDIPAFLEAADMVAIRTPDKLSVITYVSQYYNKLSTLPQLGGPGVVGKKTAAAAAAPAHGTKRHQPAEPLAEPEPKKHSVVKKSPTSDNVAKVKTLGDRCAICSNKVYLLERHVEDGKLYHRSCFRHSDLSPTNKVYTQSPFFSKKKESSAASAASAASPSEDRGSASGSGRTVIGKDDKHEVKRHAQDAESRNTGKMERKYLFPKDTDSGKRSEENKKSAKDSGLNISGYKPFQSDPSQAKAETHKSHTHSSMDFSSAGKDIEDKKSPKRHLPLVFQAAGPADNGALEKTKSGAGVKMSLFSKNKSESSPRTTDLLKKQAGDSASAHEKKPNDKSGSSAFGNVTVKNSAPVAKPRHTLLVSTHELKHEGEKTPSVPKASPRTSVCPSEGNQKSLFGKAKSPPALRKVPHTRPRSPARDSSPPPLPSSAPPPLPQTPLCVSTPLSARLMPNPSSLKPTPRKQHTPVSSNRDVASHGKLSTQKNNSALSKPVQDASLSGAASSRRANEASNGLSSFGSKTTSSDGPYHEEPMDVGTVFSKARSQYGEEPVAVMEVPTTKRDEKTALTGLLKSLAHVRNANTSASASTTVAPSKTSSTVSHLSAVSSKVTPGHTKDGGHKSAVMSVEDKGRNSSSPIDGHVEESVGKSSISISLFKAGDGSHKNVEALKKSPRASGIGSEKTLAVNKPGETVTITLNTKKAEDACKPVSVVLKQNDKSSDRVPLYKKKMGNGTEISGYSTNESKNKEGMKKERPKSAADSLGGKELSLSKQSTSSTNTSQPPPFTQVKLRDRKERGKSAGYQADSSASSSKPSWQQEAERKMAMFRDNGFVDPETKKTVGKNAETDNTLGTSSGPMENRVEKQDKTLKREAPPRPPPMHSEEKTLQAKSTDVEKKEDTSLLGGFLKGILKSGNKDTVETTNTAPPVKPERHVKKDEKQQPEETTKTASPMKPERHLRNDEKTRSEAKIVETPKASDAVGPSKQAEISGAKKKITMSSLGGSRDQSKQPSPPFSPIRSTPDRPLPLSPTSEGRKKVSVDIDFDFNMSSSMEASNQFTSSPAMERTTPPARPPAPRTSMSPGRLSAIELQQQLLEIDCKLSELELRGRRLEDSIRSVAAEEEDDMMIAWFQLVTEKNDLVRKESDLVYLSREQNLEDEQSQIESQLHYLFSKDDHDKSIEEKEEENYLIDRKVGIVNQRNCIVDSIDEDRLRYEEEDRGIAHMLQTKGFKKDGGTPQGKEKGTKVGSSKFYA